MKHKFKTIRQSAKLVDGLSEYNLRRLIKQGKIPYIKSGNRVLININTLIDYIEKGEIYE